jgi:hypothetical protein
MKMDTLFWTNLKANNNHIKFEGSKALKWGFTSSLRLNGHWLYCCTYKSKSLGYFQLRESVIERLYWNYKYESYANKLTKEQWLLKNKKLIEAYDVIIEQLRTYKENNPNLKFNFGWYESVIYGSEAELIKLINGIPNLSTNIKQVIIPSSFESETMIKDGYILTKREPPMPFRAKTSPGYIKLSSLEKVVRQVKLSPERYSVSGWFQKKASGEHSWRNVGGTSIWMSASNIYFKSEHDIALFSLIDPLLTKKIEKISLDPGVNEITKLNKVKKIKNVAKNKNKVKNE